MKQKKFTRIIGESFDKHHRVLTEDVVNGLQEAMQFGLDVMFKAQIFRVWHLSCSTHSEHVVLEDAYKALEGFADDIIESIMGITNQAATDAQREYKVSLDPWDKTLALQSIADIKNNATRLMNVLSGEEGLGSLLSDLIVELDKVVYKLIRFS